MSRNAFIEQLECQQLKAEVPHFEVGDTLKVTLKIREAEKERTQVFTGTVISRKGTGLSETFNLHRIAFGTGMERVFILHSPRIDKIEIIKEGKVRRAKLYYLRGTQGKKAKVQGRVVARKSRDPQYSKTTESTSAEMGNANENGTNEQNS
jgi:large subunit ribosomal protein L19